MRRRPSRIIEKGRTQYEKAESPGKVLVMFSGERDLDEFFAELLPDEKGRKIKEVQSRGLIVAIHARFLKTASLE